MSVQPVPAVRLSGVLLADGRNPDGSWPAAPLALTGLSVKWGRTGVLEQPVPATATARLFDPSGVWAAGVDLIGSPLEFSWSAAGTTRTWFTGRVAHAEVAPHVARLDGTPRHGALVTLTGASLLTDLGNTRPTETSWPAETVAARRDRIAALCTGPVASLSTNPAWDLSPLGVYDKPDGTTALEHLRVLYGVCGADRYTWDPHTRAMTYLTRRTLDPATAAYLARDATRPGVYIRSAGGALDGGRVVYPGAAVKDLTSRLTHVQYKYSGATSAGFTLVLPSYVPGMGTRALDITTAHTSDADALRAAHDVEAFVTGEASGWTLDEMKADLGARGFDSLAHAQLLIGGAETSAAYFLGRSWLPDLGIRPVFGVMGGTIGYGDRGWSVAWRNAPTAVTAPPPPLTWEDLDPSLVWEDTPSPASLDDSVTFADLGSVGSGLVTTT